ncbi:hypothetical protein EMIHUDRAFT_67095 [Emiliania huxleyi CCMP1516]|uniref:COX assembly mitochondrial protein n=2 Tax=Emiliania huxleyi TaxID=2903 RepID=A0A0D3IM92_EMIH1|nr:hypothetical protein EMIHUDRAFT_67095 [Emiliania huxleyi CCMP1516]EOD12377.1 hypothetical protein EMIHUDRAFT_67095 [Emiliania huxleyi CCMP1516]|eukprot:XP_005764806.1 hypothetical protein EMIHUDRAFT_67095 [Emiliania huxleyi CCMP1516]
MASFASLPAKGLPPKPPDKGSFPLDHFRECSELKSEYMGCLKQHSMQARRPARCSCAPPPTPATHAARRRLTHAGTCRRPTCSAGWTGSSWRRRSSSGALAALPRAPRRARFNTPPPRRQVGVRQEGGGGGGGRGRPARADRGEEESGLRGGYVQGK